MIGWILGEFWPFIVGALGIVGAFFAGGQNAKRKQDSNTLKEIRKRTDAEREIRDEDRDTLADRITKP